MDGIQIQQSIDALIDDVDAVFQPPAAPRGIAALPHVEGAPRSRSHAAIAQSQRADAARPVVVRTSKRTVVAATLMGFVAGAVCWHLLGFWWFVSDIMFHRRGEPMEQIARPSAVSLKEQTRRGGVAGPVALASLDRCSNAVRAGSPAETVTGACETVAVRFNTARGLGRTDLGDFGPSPVPTLISGTPPQSHSSGPAAVGGWSARIEKASPNDAGN